MKKQPYSYVKNCLKPPKAFFEWCYENMPTYEWSNKQETIIGSTRNHYFTHKKRLAKNSRLTFFDREDKFKIILSTSKRIEIQTYEVASFFNHGKQDFRVQLLNLEHLSNEKYIKVGRTGKNEYKFGLMPTCTMFNYWYSRPVVYPNDWLKRLCNISELRYLELAELEINAIPYIYKYRERIEFSQRIKAPKLAKQLINKQLDMRTVNMNWLKRNKVFFRNSSRTFEVYQLKQALEGIGTKYIEGIEKYLEAKEIAKIPKEVKPITFQNYLIKQQQPFHFYRDYIKLLQELRIPVTPMRRLPKDLKVAHDKAVSTLNAKKRECVRKEFMKRAEELDFLEMKIGDVEFILPKEASELIEEGKKLKHCVGGSHYIDEHADGDTTIVFIRKITYSDIPYFTLEYRNKKVVQVHGYNHKRPSKELKLIVDEWLDKANKFMRQRGSRYAA